MMPAGGIGSGRSGAGARWYVVQTRPHKESFAAQNLANQGFRPFVARIRKTVRHARRLTSVNAPLFPRYIFVSLDLERDRWRSVRCTFGVSSLVMEGERPLPVPAGVVEQLIEHSDPAGALDFRPELKAGQAVRVLHGPFADHIGRLVSMDPAGRVSVLLDMLGSERVVTMPADGLIPIRPGM